MPEILRCSNPACNSLIRVYDCRVGASVPCPACKQFTIIPPAPSVQETASIRIRGPFPYFLLVCVMLGCVLACVSAWLTIVVLQLNETEMLYGIGMGLVVQFVLCVGLLLGHRLTRQATMVLTMLWLLLNSIGVCIAVCMFVLLYVNHRLDIHDSATIPSIALVGLEIVRIFVAVALVLNLNAPDARQYFGIACPYCGDLDGQPADFFFHRVRCPRCRFTWTG